MLKSSNRRENILKFAICPLGLVLLLLNSCCNAKTGKPLPQPTKVLESDGSKVLVYDNIFGSKPLGLLSELLRRYAPWDFIYPEESEGATSNDNGDLHWIAAFSPENFSKSKVWKFLKKKLPGVFNAGKYMPYEANGVLINRGDFPTVQKAKNNGDVFMRIFLTEEVKKNDYSELVFYNRHEEIFGAVHQKLGRVIVWNDTADFIFKPPSMNQHGGEYSIFIKATLYEGKFEKAVADYKEKAKERSRMSKEQFPLTNITDDSIYKINLTQHLTRKFQDSHNRTIAVFDDVVPRHVIDALRSYFFKYDSSYVYNPHDPEHGEETDNVKWVAQVQAEQLPLSLVWQYVHHVASYLSGETDWHPYDVSMNIIQHNQHPRIHADCNEWEHEYTFLMYLNPDWTTQRYGETIFFEETDKKKKNSRKFRVGDEKYETITAIVPKFGRIAMFRNIIDHSARPPSPDFLAARYTFAVKVGRSPQIAIGKKLRELLGDFDDENKARLKLAEDLTQGKFDSGNSKREFLEKKYSQYLKKKNTMDKEYKSYYHNLMS